MALADPQSVTIASDTISLPRTGFTSDTGTFQAADAAVELIASHRKGSRVRHTLRLNHKKVVPDPLVEGVSRVASMSVITTIDVPSDGYTLTEAKAVATSVATWLTASSGANLSKLLGSEV